MTFGDGILSFRSHLLLERRLSRNTAAAYARDVAALASFLASRGEAETRAPQADYPLSMTQNGILAESLSHPDSTIYNLPTLFRLPDGTTRTG